MKKRKKKGKIREKEGTFWLMCLCKGSPAKVPAPNLVNMGGPSPATLVMSTVLRTIICKWCIMFI